MRTFVNTVLLGIDCSDGLKRVQFRQLEQEHTVEAEEIVYALISVCTHLGCTPNWLPTQNKFKCPCHGSGYYKSGVNFEGPTPRPLERAKIFIDPSDGQIVVDKSKQFHQERGEWTDPEAFIKA